MESKGKCGVLNEAIEIALRTWYPESHLLHMNPHHPLGKLMGEWGELLDDYMKSLYKPGYEFEPIDELGDIWYYLRILCYQSNIRMREIERITLSEKENFTLIFSEGNTETLISTMGYFVSSEFLNYKLYGKYGSALLIPTQYTAIKEIAKRSDISIKQLTESNWEKLKPGSERGEQWMKARQV